MPRDTNTEPVDPDFAAAATIHDIAHWQEHPEVLSIELVEVEDDDPADPSIGVAFWLRPGGPAIVEVDVADISNLQPSRPPDIELSGEGVTNDNFWLRAPNLEYMMVAQEPPDETMPEGWWMVQLWLKTAVN
jgi:hypothetical protein